MRVIAPRDGTLKARIYSLRSRLLFAACISLLGVGPCLAQGSRSTDELADQARREYTAAKFSEAERDFRELTKRDPSSTFAEVYLGHALFRQEKYAEAVAPYQAARDLESAAPSSPPISTAFSLTSWPCRTGSAVI